MVIRRASVYRLYPTLEQQQRLARWAGAVRATYNVALEQRRDWYRPGRQFTVDGQCREVTTLRAEFDWIRDVPVHALQSAIRDLDRAYQNWRERRTSAPTPRKRGVNDTMRFSDPVTFDFRRISRHWGEVKLPKMGWVRLRWDRATVGRVRSITVTRRAGVWTVAAQCEHEIADPPSSLLPAVGIDRGITVFAALSNGTMIAPVNAGKKAQRALARAQRKLSRKVRDSKNREKARRRIARLHARIARIRRDFCHKASAYVAKNHGIVVLEKLQISNMVRSASGTVERPGRNVRAKAGLNRSILDQAWGMFGRFCDYKLSERGGEVRWCEPRNSSRECLACGLVDRRNRNRTRFLCVGCGNSEHADTNASKVILKRGGGTALLPVEASRERANEAGTIWSTA